MLHTFQKYIDSLKSNRNMKFRWRTQTELRQGKVRHPPIKIPKKREVIVTWVFEELDE